LKVREAAGFGVADNGARDLSERDCGIDLMQQTGLNGGRTADKVEGHAKGGGGAVGAGGAGQERVSA